MVDDLTHADGDEATCALTVRPDNFFIGEDNRMEEVGLIEHIAQSASAFAGHKAIAEGATEPPVGYIGEVKNFHLYHRPHVGECLVTTITMGATVGGVTIIRGETKTDNGTPCADTMMKIFINE